MTVDTKFDVGELVFVLLENRTAGGIVQEITINIKGEGDLVIESYAETLYDIDGYGEFYRGVSEKDICSTEKEAAVKLMEQLGFEVSEDGLKEIT